jgi:hypothetical protein
LIVWNPTREKQNMDQGDLDVSTLQHYLKGTNFPLRRRR